MSPASLQQQVEKLLMQSLRAQDPQVEVQIRRNSFGWLRLSVVTRLFDQKGLDERKAQINTIITPLDLNIDDYPFSHYQLLTPQQAEEQLRISPVQVPLWSEILLAPDPDVELLVDEEEDAKERKDEPFVAAFYSFKGGVGRSTALAFVANILAADGYRVVMIDFDLEAPGLSFAHPVEGPGAITCGVLDYIYQRDLTPTEDEPKIEDCIRQINLPVRGELYLIPAGAYDENYIHRLADLNIHAFYQREKNPIHQLLEDVKQSLKPHVILIDARTGFTEMGAIALFDQADLGIICFSPTKQSYAGLEWVVKAANKQRKYNGIPDLRFLLTPMPPVAQVQEQEWLGQAADWIVRNWGVLPSLTADDLYYSIPYNPSITTLDNLFIDVPSNILESYKPIADAINASLPEEIPAIFASSDIKISEHRQVILDQLTFKSPTAQDMDKADIPTIFQRTSNFSQFLQDQKWLVLGAKGTGKTLLFRLFIEKSLDARNFAKQSRDIHNVQFIPGHGPLTLRATLLESGSLGDYETSIGVEGWPQFWPNYLLLQLASSLDGIQQILSDPFLVRLSANKQPSQKQIVQWLEQRFRSSYSASQTLGDLKAIDEWLIQRGQKTWIFYDELDTGFGQKERRRVALEALLDWWLEVGSSFSCILPKILLRTDIWDDLSFTNQTRYSARTISLRWDEGDLWKLVLRQALTSERFSAVVRQQTTLEKDRLDSNIPSEVLRRALFPLWGERMGRTNKAYTYSWVMKRIGDYKGNRFPRSLIQLLQQSTEIEKDTIDRNPSSYSSEVILRPRSLIDALPFVSRERVGEVRTEYREFREFLDKLEAERSPITLTHLQEIWELDSLELKALIQAMDDAGIVRAYPFPQRIQNSEAPRYSVAELYLSGLKMTRLGRR